MVLLECLLRAVATPTFASRRWNQPCDRGRGDFPSGKGEAAPQCYQRQGRLCSTMRASCIRGWRMNAGKNRKPFQAKCGDQRDACHGSCCFSCSWSDWCVLCELFDSRVPPELGRRLLVRRKPCLCKKYSVSLKGVDIL